MASLYDIIMVKGMRRYRLNKNFIAQDKVPGVVMESLNENNIVDENGNIIVDQKNDEAKKPSADNEKELGSQPSKLKRVDQEEETPEAPKAPTTPEPTTAPAPAVDDTANQTNIQEEEKDDDPATDNPTEDSEGDEPDRDTAAPKTATPPEEPAKAAPPKPQAPAPAKPARATEPVEKFRSKVPQSNPGMGFPRKNGKTVDIFDLETPHTHVKFVGGHTVPLSKENFVSRSEGQIIARLKELGFEIVDLNELQRQQNIDRQGGNGGLVDEDEEDDDIRLG